MELMYAHWTPDGITNRLLSCNKNLFYLAALLEKIYFMAILSLNLKMRSSGWKRLAVKQILGPSFKIRLNSR